MALRDILGGRGSKRSADHGEPSGLPPIRVLILDDDNTDFVIARESLKEIKDPYYEVEWAATYEDAVDLLRSNTYDVYLLDYRLGKRSGLDFMRDELANGAKGPAIVLTNDGQRALDEQALKCGASGFLVKSETSPTEIDRAIRYAIQSHRAKLSLQAGASARVRCKIASFIGAKGGVGTTTVALNVAVALAERGFRVFAIDLRPMFGTLAQQAGVEASRDLGDLISIAAEEIDEAKLEECIVEHPSTARVLAAPQTLSGHRPIQPAHVAKILELLTPRADYIIIDLPRDLLPSTRAAVAASQIGVLVTSREPTGLTSARMGAQILRAWNAKAPMATVVVDRAALPFPLAAAQIAATLDLDLYGYIAADKDVFYEVLTMACPIVQARRSHFSAQALLKVADALIDLEVESAFAAEAER